MLKLRMVRFKWVRYCISYFSKNLVEPLLVGFIILIKVLVIL